MTQLSTVTVQTGKPMDACVVVTMGRLMFAETALNIMESVARFGCPVSFNSYPYWEQGITMAIESALQTGKKWLLFFDGDSAYEQKDLEALYELGESDPKIDAVVPIQADRNGPNPLCYNWQCGDKKIEYAYDEPVTQVAHGHFGMTFIKAQVFKDLPQPWFMGHPGKDGTWKRETGKIDPDTHFWLLFNKHGKICAQANTVVCGHQQTMIRWQMPWGAYAQSVSEFRAVGKPVGARVPLLKEVEAREHKEKALKLIAQAGDLLKVPIPMEKEQANTSVLSVPDTELPHTYGEMSNNGQHDEELESVGAERGER